MTSAAASGESEDRKAGETKAVASLPISNAHSSPRVDVCCVRISRNTDVVVMVLMLEGGSREMRRQEENREGNSCVNLEFHGTLET